MTLSRKIFLAGIASLLLSTWPGSLFAQEFALALYGAQMTREKWEQAILPGAQYTDATLLAVAGAWTAKRFFNDQLSWEMEAVVGKHFGGQHHWEFDLSIFGFRWHRFPWDEHLATSLAWGIGPSYATRIPKVELDTNENSNRWLIYWFGELTMGPPKARWEALLRLHHRSDGFGTVHEDGGSNALGAGVRYHF